MKCAVYLAVLCGMVAIATVSADTNSTNSTDNSTDTNSTVPDPETPTIAVGEDGVDVYVGSSFCVSCPTTCATCAKACSGPTVKIVNDECVADSNLVASDDLDVVQSGLYTNTMLAELSARVASSESTVSSMMNCLSSGGLWKSDSSTCWTPPAGAAGDAGNKGVAGDKGPQGNQGPTGPQGNPGKDGVTGPVGDRGDDAPVASCPGGWRSVREGRLCHSPVRAAANMNNAIKNCWADQAYPCTHDAMLQACGDPTMGAESPYEGQGGGWYGDHGRVPSGGNWDDEYGTWNSASCQSNNDGPPEHSNAVKAYKCCL